MLSSLMSIIFLLIILCILCDGQVVLPVPTEGGFFQFSSSMLPTAKQEYPIPVTISAMRTNGSISSEYNGEVQLRAIVGYSENILLQDTFATFSGWSRDSGSTISAETGFGAAGSTSSAKITGYNTSFRFGGGYKLWGTTDAAKWQKPVRLSCYMMSADVSKPSAFVALREWYGGTWYEGIAVYFNSGTIYARGDTTKSIGRTVVSNTWYKLDIVIKWGSSANTADIYIDDILSIVNCDLADQLATYSLGGVFFYNYETVTSWVDEVKVVLSASNSTTIPLSLSSVTLSNGQWSGSVVPLQTGSNVRLQVVVTGANPTSYLHGETNNFTLIPGCVPGQYSPSYDASCFDCPLGSFSNNSSSTVCPQCSPGTFSNSTRSTTCYECPIQTYNPDFGANSSAACYQCQNGTSQAGSSFCSTCSAGEFIDGAVCSPCPSGTYGFGTATCIDCPPGTYNTHPGQNSCTLCQPGKFSNETRATSALVCQQCPNNTYSGYGSVECTPCGIGEYSAPGQASCTQCGQGTHQNFPDRACIPCDVGQYNVYFGSTSCTDCFPGYYTNKTGTVLCDACPTGYYSGPKASICLPCDPGYYADYPGRGTCLPCWPGSFTNTSTQTTCHLCAAGETSVGYAPQSCTKCGIGLYSNYSGSPSCIPCDAGYTTLQVGSTFCVRMCGDGILETGEGCDDGNEWDGDGCSINCHVESGYECPTPGSLCQLILTTGSSTTGTTSSPTGSQVTTSPLGTTSSPTSTSSTTSLVATTTSATTHSGTSAPITTSTGPTPNNPQDRVQILKESNQSTIVAVGVSLGLGVPIIAAIGITAFIVYKRKRDRELMAHIQKERMSLSLNSSAIPIPRGSITDYANIPLDRGSISLSVSPDKSAIFANSKSQFISYKELQMDYSKILGRGAFGVVFRAKWRGLDVAVKEVKGQSISEHELAGFIEEAELMRNLKPHPHVVLFMGVVSDPFCIVTEFMEGGDLRTLLQSNQEITMDVKMKIIRGVATGMLHLAAEGIVHRDLAARNILLTKTKDAKVSDFGLSRIADTSNAIYSMSDVGPLKWMSPEAIRKKKYSEKSDVWSFGVCCSEILTRSDPYPDMDAVQVATAVVSENMHPIIPSDTPPELYRIVEMCFTFEVNDRPSFQIICDELSKIA